MTLNVPCKDCPDRYLNCHTYCEEYLDYLDAKEQMKQQIKKVSEIEAYQKASASKNKRIKEERKKWRPRYASK